MCNAYVEFKNGKVIKGKGHLVICDSCGILAIKDKKKKRRKYEDNRK